MMPLGVMALLICLIWISRKKKAIGARRKAALEEHVACGGV
jgi:hypothetical protein